MSNGNDRRLSYKLPPTSVRESLVSQEARRTKALEDQKRRRAQRVDSARQLDLFANLNINDDSDEDDIAEEEESLPSTTPSAAVGPYVAMLKASDKSSGVTDETNELTSASVNAISEMEVPIERKKRKKKNKKRSTNYSKPSKWADQCMYAELLEMTAEEPLWGDGHDGLPKDLETSWVAVAPVPVGKRCLVVTHQSPGVGGVVPNTTLRSRLLGKSLIPRFPSPLPALTVLDCILDANWRDNGIIHVLDVIKWKGQDIGDCEAPFRFWWRDTRLGELSRTLPPTINFFKKPKHGNGADANRYQFPYPTYFLPIPYHANTSLSSLENQVIPAARMVRTITVDVPSPVQFPRDTSSPQNDFTFSMEVETPSNSLSSSPFVFASSSAPSVALSPVPATIQSDGLLLYVADASYEPGTSPLSSWVPIVDIHTGEMEADGDVRGGDPNEGPLDLFHRLVKKRLDRGQLDIITVHDTGPDVSMVL